MCCEADSIWKYIDSTKHISHRVLKHFPLILRPKRTFFSSKTAKNAPWYKLKQNLVNYKLSHPVDSPAWKDFDKNWLSFADDARNITLDLASIVCDQYLLCCITCHHGYVRKNQTS